MQNDKRIFQTKVVKYNQQEESLVLLIHLHLKIAVNNFKCPIDLVTFNLRENKNDRISLSWHLTKNEKQKIERAFRSRQNKNSLIRLKNLLK